MKDRGRVRRLAARVAVGLIAVSAVGTPLGFIATPAASAAGKNKASATTPKQGTAPTATTPAGGSPTATMPSASSGCGDGFGGFSCRVNNLKGPGTAVVGSLSGVGLLIGAGMLGVGQQGGMRMMGISAAAGAGILVGNGVISALT